ncbi:pleckstrin homology domain-containing family M member 2-like [Biomphalaria glabrata]|uniref:Pleckstrin homology domain-containing family M member 2-like n=1 Tax=Biomphalaria glabrata TaxID=6526 RepID=A0A9W2YLI8_BIOGL|nr:pleckstrin homology domain-containing family M member 2-like [Biomphalaria glabrata]
MARPAADRMRLKDKIIDNISKAIKSIQELLYYQSTNPVLNGGCVTEIRLTLTNSDRQCHKLCENLDHALLHGLKHVTHGYWPVVKQLSHKGLVRDIEILVNVTTDLGRGRAWLFAMLNEGLLECYINLLVQNEKLLRKFYAKDALLLDGDRMTQLQTLTSGLEFVTFKFELDLPYLDLNAYPPRSRTDAQLVGDVLSTSPSSLVNGKYSRSASLISALETSSGSLESRSMLPSDSDSLSTTSSDAHTQADQGLQMRLSTYSTDSGFPADSLFNSTTTLKQRSVTPPDIVVNRKARSVTPSDNISVASLGSTGEQDRHQRLENLNPATEEDDNGKSQVLEVIRITKKTAVAGKPKKKRNLSNKKETSNKKSVEAVPADTKSDQRVEVGTAVNKDIVDSPLDSHNNEIHNNLPDLCDAADSKLDIIPGEVSCSIPKYDSGLDIATLTPDTERGSTPVSPIDAEDLWIPSELKNDQVKVKNVNSMPAMSSMATIKSKIDSLCVGNNSDSSSHIDHSFSHSNHLSQPPESQHMHDSSHTLHPHFSSSDSPPTKADTNSLFTETCMKPTNDDHATSRNPSNDVKLPIFSEDDFYSCYSEKDKSDVPALHYQENSVSRAKAALQSSSQLKDYMDYILKSNQNPSPSNAKGDRERPQDQEDDLSVSLDNNAKLQIMLEILSHEDEKFLKMFVSRENMMEGDAGVIYLLVSDQCLYFLKYKESSRKFVLRSSAMLSDLIFISTGLNDQMISIESRGQNKQKQRLWVTPGHQALTKCILEHLTVAVRKANEHFTSVRPRFSVGSEVPLQKIALRKYISKELNCEPSDVVINDYSLVFWEDPSSANRKQDQDAHKEGTLLMWTQDPMKGYIWKPVYVVLKDSMLSVSNHKTDTRPHSLLGLGGDQCIGCRLTSVGDRNNCVELVTARGGSWFLSAASEVEIAQWRHALCLAVSKGVEDDSSLISCVPCCAVLACGTVFLCHEDLQTKFFRTLGRAKVEDLTSLRTDDSDPTYCILEFESQEVGVSSVNWVFYFTSVQDLQRYQTAIGQVWKEKYQVDVPVLLVDNAGLQRSCLSHSQLLHQQLCFS